ncbi:unnamed protein product [Cuscuta campestris]|uniref:Fatty acid desaturase domain-containing protein n=1 Tax=Cuscuta campestris TaxID=132261 RepID=A0A484LFI4_9ASTE|nr:unnamed protein product [Cuscuta campestris]
MYAPFCFSWDAVVLWFVLYIITGIGMTVSYHRNLCHKSFKLPKWLEYMLSYFGVLALQGDPIGWVSTHRHHHKYTDSLKDPHSPNDGFWFSHMGWIYDTKNADERSRKASNVGDLESQAFYIFIRKTYLLHHILFGALLFSIGGFPYIVWGMDCMGVPCNISCEFCVSHLGKPSMEHQRLIQKQLDGGAGDIRGRVAQQPPRL